MILLFSKPNPNHSHKKRLQFKFVVNPSTNKDTNLIIKEINISHL